MSRALQQEIITYRISARSTLRSRTSLSLPEKFNTDRMSDPGTPWSTVPQTLHHQTLYRRLSGLSTAESDWSRSKLSCRLSCRHQCRLLKFSHHQSSSSAPHTANVILFSCWSFHCQIRFHKLTSSIQSWRILDLAHMSDFHSLQLLVLLYLTAIVIFWC